jgi:hypothetical protein
MRAKIEDNIRLRMDFVPVNTISYITCSCFIAAFSQPEFRENSPHHDILVPGFPSVLWLDRDGRTLLIRLQTPR